MVTNLRQFHRELARMRRMAADGVEVIVRDRWGNTFVFKRISPQAATMAEVVGHLAGAVETGKRVKSLKGYGRKT